MATAPDSAHQDMNRIIHDALRRDLDRLARVLQSPMPDDQRAALCRHVDWMLDQLHHHHVGEDEGVWPRVLAKRPDLQEMVDEMAAEHEVLAAASDGLRAAAAEFSRDGSDDARQDLADAVALMQEATLPHLDHEEEAAMPLVLDTLDDEDWDYLEKEHFRKGVGLREAAVLFMWLLDDLDDRRAGVVKGEVPGPLLWVLTLVYGPRYDSGARARWGALAGRRS